MAPERRAESAESPPPAAARTLTAPTPADWIGRIPAPAPPVETLTPVVEPVETPTSVAEPVEPVETPTSVAEPVEPVETPTSVADSAHSSVVEPVETPTHLDETGMTAVEGAWYAELPVTSIVPNARQPRQVFDEDALAELEHSIREVGLLQPVVVRPAGVDTYELIMGERRWRASQAAGLTLIPAIVRDTADEDLLRDALLENLHRAELNPLEEAAAYQQLLDDFGCTHEELAGRIGRSRPQISNTLRLLKLSPSVQRRVAAGVLSAGHARTLLGVVDPAAQDRLAARVVSEGISVRGLEELVAVGELGEEPAARTRRTRPTAPAVVDLADRLSDLYETRVKVDLGSRKGRITIEFASLPDLERIVAAMDPTYERRHVDE